MGEMMGKGKILKVRLGHEANCSSGMVAIILWGLGTATYLLLAIVAAIVQATIIAWRRPSWIILPILVALFAAPLAYVALTNGLGDSSHPHLLFVLPAILSYVLTVIIGYVLASRLESPYHICLVTPMIFVTCDILLSLLIFSVLDRSVW
jgi:hypothetical protein